MATTAMPTGPDTVASPPGADAEAVAAGTPDSGASSSSAAQDVSTSDSSARTPSRKRPRSLQQLAEDRQEGKLTPYEQDLLVRKHTHSLFEKARLIVVAGDVDIVISVVKKKRQKKKRKSMPQKDSASLGKPMEDPGLYAMFSGTKEELAQKYATLAVTVAKGENVYLR